MSEVPNPPAVDKSRQELALMLKRLRDHERLPKKTIDVLAKHLCTNGVAVYLSHKKIEEHLNSVGDMIPLRQEELITKQVATRHLGYTGLLGLATGDKNRPSMQRDKLLHHSSIQRKAAENSVDPNVVLDVYLRRDLDWLTAPLVSRRQSFDSEAERRRNGLV